MRDRMSEETVLYYLGAASKDECTPIYHYYIRKDVYHEETLYVPHLNTYRHSNIMASTYNPETGIFCTDAANVNPKTGKLCSLRHISPYEGELNTAGGIVSVWFTEPNSKDAKCIFGDWYHEKAVWYQNRIKRIECLLDQMNTYSGEPNER